MRKLSALFLAVLLTFTPISAAAGARDDESPSTCEADGDAYCEVPTCEEEAAAYTARIAGLERRLARADRRIQHKNATIARLRAKLAAQR